MEDLTDDQLTGRDESHLVSLQDGHRLQAEVARAFTALQADAAAAGFELAIVSSFRSFRRQLQIWNAKASGRRSVHDNLGRPVNMSRLSDRERLHAILRFSALPGTSRHHWGTDLDVMDKAAVPAGYQVSLSPEEVSPGGVFDALHRWLDERMAEGQSHGFYRPYGVDRGGVAPERWHLSFAPLARSNEGRLDSVLLRSVWDECDKYSDGEGLLLRDSVEKELSRILERFVEVPANGC